MSVDAGVDPEQLAQNAQKRLVLSIETKFLQQQLFVMKQQIENLVKDSYEVGQTQNETQDGDMKVILMFKQEMLKKEKDMLYQKYLMVEYKLGSVMAELEKLK